MVTDLGPVSEVCGLGLNLLGCGLGSEVSLGVALGSLGLFGVHVHFYKFIVVGSKSMPRGVSPKVGVW